MGTAIITLAGVIGMAGISSIVVARLMIEFCAAFGNRHAIHLRRYLDARAVTQTVILILIVTDLLFAIGIGLKE